MPPTASFPMATPWPSSPSGDPAPINKPALQSLENKKPGARPGLHAPRSKRSGGGRTIAATAAARARGPAAVRAGRSAPCGGLAAGASAVSVVVPAAALELKGTHGNQLAHLAAAPRADREGRIGDTLLNFKDFFASTAFILIHRHGATSQLSILRLRRDRNFKQGKDNVSRPPCQLPIRNNPSSRRPYRITIHHLGFSIKTAYNRHSSIMRP